MKILTMSIGVLALVTWGAANATAQERKPVDIWSDGTRMSGDLWLPVDIADGERHPAIVLAQGWGGLRDQLNATYALDFAAAGFVVLTFDYRGWGDSDSRLVLLGTQPAPDSDGTVTVRARAIRGVVDPQDQVVDLLAAVAFVMGEPQVDPDRIGLWGFSYGGGHVIEASAREPGILAVVAQVGFMGVSRSNERRELGRVRAVQKARGEIPPIPVGLDQLGGASPDLARMVAHRPLDSAHKVRAATLIIDAENDQYFDSAANGRAVYDIMVGNGGTARYQLFPGDHYTASGPHRQEALKLTIAWFQAHLARGD
jgi:dienelactone hydrolase